MALACTGARVDTIRDVEYVTGQSLDIHLPETTAGSVVVVLLHGAGLDRDDYEVFATELARSGAVVYNADWTVLPPIKRQALEEIACAVRFARSDSRRVGADPDHLVLVGHSTAAVFAGEVATSGDIYSGDCPIEGNARPSGLALISPAQVTGGAPWDLQTLGGNPQLPIAIVHGEDDSVARPSLSERIHRDLRSNGYQATLHLVEGGHFDPVLVDIDGDGVEFPEAGAKAVEIILALVS